MENWPTTKSPELEPVGKNTCVDHQGRDSHACDHVEIAGRHEKDIRFGIQLPAKPGRFCELGQEASVEKGG